MVKLKQIQAVEGTSEDEELSFQVLCFDSQNSLLFGVTEGSVFM